MGSIFSSLVNIQQCNTLWLLSTVRDTIRAWEENLELTQYQPMMYIEMQG